MYTVLVLHYAKILFLFFLDLVFQGFFACPTYYFTRSMYYTALFKKLPVFEYFFLGSLVVIQSFLYNGCCGVDLIVMVPLTMAAFYLRSTIDLNPLVHALLALCGILIHYAVIDYGLINRPLFCMFSLQSIVIHFIIVLILVYTLFKGSLGNRSKP